MGFHDRDFPPDIYADYDCYDREDICLNSAHLRVKPQAQRSYAGQDRLPLDQDRCQKSRCS